MKSALHLQMRSIAPSRVTEGTSGAVSINGEPHALHDTLHMRTANAQVSTVWGSRYAHCSLSFILRTSSNLLTPFLMDEGLADDLQEG